LRDDGGIVYLNGTEVFRSYMTNGIVTYTNLAGLAARGRPRLTMALSIGYHISNTLITGLNIIAVEIHQDAINSSTSAFDLMLWGQGPTGPRLTITPTTLRTLMFRGRSSPLAIGSNSRATSTRRHGPRKRPRCPRRQQTTVSA